MTQIGAIEDKMLDYLGMAGELNVLPYKFGTLKNYPLDWDKEIATTTKWPAVWVSFGGWPQPEALRRGARVKASFAVVVGAKNVRSAEAARQGGPIASEIGTLQLMEGAVSILHGNSLELEIGALELGPVTFVPPTAAMIAAGVSLCIIQFTTVFVFDRMMSQFRPDAEFVGDLKTIHFESGRPQGETVDLTATATIEEES